MVAIKGEGRDGEDAGDERDKEDCCLGGSGTGLVGRGGSCLVIALAPRFCSPVV